MVMTRARTFVADECLSILALPLYNCYNILHTLRVTSSSATGDEDTSRSRLFWVYGAEEKPSRHSSRTVSHAYFPASWSS
jgi:hypothetical protein